MKIKVINGPNLNTLGIREPNLYGKTNYKELVKLIKKECKKLGVSVKVVQSNHEGDLVTEIQRCYKKYDGIVINPAAYTHTSIAILDAVKSINIPTVEVHISKIEEREDFRQVSYIRSACIKTISGEGITGYISAIQYLNENI